MRSLALAFALFLPLSAAAGDYYVEGPELPRRDEANAASQAAEDAGLQARVVRRMGKESGWRYVVRVEGIEEESNAKDAAADLATALHAAVGVYAVDQGAAQLVATIEGAAPARKASRHAVAPAGGGDDAAPVLEEAAKAHKVTGLAVGTAPVQFRFRRDLGEAGVADHTFARRGDDLYLEVEPVSGQVVASKLKLVGDKAWLSVDGGPWQEQNVEKARQTAEAMGPTKVLPFILVLDTALQSRRELLRMERSGVGSLDGVDVDVLSFPGDQAAQPVQVEVSVSDRMVQRVSFDGGELVYRFSAPEKVSGMVLPTQVLTERGGEAVDRVAILELDVDAKLPAAWFTAP